MEDWKPDEEPDMSKELEAIRAYLQEVKHLKGE